jgi:hypothetical protein
MDVEERDLLASGGHEPRGGVALARSTMTHECAKNELPKQTRLLVGELHVRDLRLSLPVGAEIDAAGHRITSLRSEVAPYLDYAHGI